MIPSIPSIPSSSSSSARIRIPHHPNKNIPIGIVVEERPNPHRSQLPSHHYHHHQRQQQHTRATRATHRFGLTTRVVRIILVLIGIYFIIVIVWTLYIHHYSLSTGISSSILSSLLLIQQHNDDYELAKLESYGFFTDIDSVTWRRHQQHAHSAIYDETIYYNRSYPNDQADTNPAAWLMTNVQQFFTCPNLRRLGGHGDGAKWTCDPHRFVLESDCLIYSVGSSGSYVFEDTIVSYSRHQNNIDNNRGKDGTITSTTCEIHVFDPEPSYARINDAIHNNIHYHAWALQSSRVHKVIDPKKKKYKWQVEYKNIYEIIQLLGHEHRRIDVLKLDCEGCEWTTYMDWLFMTTPTTTTNHNHNNISVDIRQILMETHALPPIINNNGGPESFYNAMIQNHYVLYSKEANTHPGARPFGLFYEWSWLKLHPNFFV